MLAISEELKAEVEAAVRAHAARKAAGEGWARERRRQRDAREALATLKLARANKVERALLARLAWRAWHFAGRVENGGERERVEVELAAVAGRGVRPRLVCETCGDTFAEAAERQTHARRCRAEIENEGDEEGEPMNGDQGDELPEQESGKGAVAVEAPVEGLDPQAEATETPPEWGPPGPAPAKSRKEAARVKCDRCGVEVSARGIASHRRGPACRAAVKEEQNTHAPRRKLRTGVDVADTPGDGLTDGDPLLAVGVARAALAQLAPELRPHALALLVASLAGAS